MRTNEIPVTVTILEAASLAQSIYIIHIIYSSTLKSNIYSIQNWVYKWQVVVLHNCTLLIIHCDECEDFTTVTKQPVIIDRITMIIKNRNKFDFNLIDSVLPRPYSRNFSEYHQHPDHFSKSPEHVWRRWINSPLYQLFNSSKLMFAG